MLFLLLTSLYTDDSQSHSVSVESWVSLIITEKMSISLFQKSVSAAEENQTRWKCYILDSQRRKKPQILLLSMNSLVSWQRRPIFRMGKHSVPDFQSISGTYPLGKEYKSFPRPGLGPDVCFIIIPNQISNVLLDLKSAGFHRVTSSPEALKNAHG